jgi:hypothetical protein
MSKLLEEMFNETRRLPEDEQDDIAELIREQLADNRRWEESFARNPAKLAAMAAEALRQSEAGEAKEMGWDEL